MTRTDQEFDPVKDALYEYFNACELLDLADHANDAEGIRAGRYGVADAWEHFEAECRRAGLDPAAVNA
ncbi:hypothetical protein KGD82_16475 [Nocardiopsis eucommiae]|uniref:Uncharacterized protein n=1 Tax=Nocardiopsis eucommiae TaxID=2831970 RepID=A0A975L720_9ACTN|nr:hypothetical protein KGD82_16475 [Nocardiopsis eucommiae]